MKTFEFDLLVGPKIYNAKRTYRFDGFNKTQARKKLKDYMKGQTYQIIRCKEIKE